MTDIDNILMKINDISNEHNKVLEQLTENIIKIRNEAYEAGLTEGLETTFKTLKLEPKDTLVVMTNDGNNRTLRSRLNQMRIESNLSGIIVVEKEDDIKNLSEINMHLMGWEKIKVTTNSK